MHCTTNRQSIVFNISLLRTIRLARFDIGPEFISKGFAQYLKWKVIKKICIVSHISSFLKWTSRRLNLSRQSSKHAYRSKGWSFWTFIKVCQNFGSHIRQFCHATNSTSPAKLFVHWKLWARFGQFKPDPQDLWPTFKTCAIYLPTGAYCLKAFPLIHRDTEGQRDKEEERNRGRKPNHVHISNNNSHF